MPRVKTIKSPITVLTLVLLMLCVSVFSACGKKGSLYLPLDPEPTVQAEADSSKNLGATKESQDSKKKSSSQAQ